MNAGNTYRYETLEARKKRYIGLIQKFYKEHGRIPKRREMNSYASVFRKTFGSWNNAIIEAGYEPNRRSLPSKAILRNSILKFYLKHKRPPKALECTSENNLHDAKSYMRVFEVDTWGKVLEHVGLRAYFHVSGLTKDKSEAKRIIIDFIKKKNIRAIDDYKAIKPKDLPSSAFITENFGWKNLLIEAGVTEEISFENIKKKIFEFNSENGFPPSTSQLAKLMKCTPRNLTSITGTYNIFLKSIGLDPKSQTPKKVTLTNQELIDLYKRKSEIHGYENGISSPHLKSLTGVGEDIFALRFGSINNLRLISGFTPLTKNRLKYTRKGIIDDLYNYYLKLGRIPTIKEHRQNKNIASPSSVLRYLKCTNFKEVWKIVFKEKTK